MKKSARPLESSPGVVQQPAAFKRKLSNEETKKLHKILSAKTTPRHQKEELKIIEEVQNDHLDQTAN